MYTVVVLTSFLVFFGQSAFGQTNNPVLPEGDYTVYAAIANDFSKCNDIQYAHRQGNLLFIKSITEAKSKHGFRFNFAKVEEQLSFLIRPQATFYKESGWKTFIAAVDTNQFTRYEINHPLELRCRKTEMWSPKMQDYYFSKENHMNRGFYTLRNDYKNFGGIIGFSKVAYSADRQKALCYYSEVSDGKAGAGYLVFLEKREDTWTVMGSAELWGA